VTREIAPPPDGGAPPPLARRELVLAAGASLLAALLFHSLLIFGGSLHHFDWDSHHFHYFDWLRTSLVSFRTLPLYMADAWVTPHFLANAESPILGPLVPLLLVLSTEVYIELLIVVWTAVGLLGTFALLRDLEVGLPAAVLAALVFACNGFFASHLGVGHHWAMGAQALPALVCLFRRAVLGSRAALLGAAALDAITILGGQHQPFVWQNLWLGLFALLWALRVRSPLPLLRFAALGLAAAGLAAIKLAPMLAEFGDYDPSARIQGLPPQLLLASLSARGQDPTLAFASIAYQHGSGWWEYAHYVGPVALAALAVGVAGARGAGALLWIGALFLVLGVEWTGALRPLHLWSLFEHLPVWSSQRCPSRFLVLAVFAFAVAGALGLERVWRFGRARAPRGAAIAAALLCAWVAADLFRENRAWQRAALGPPLASRPHEPRPLLLRPAQGTSVELREFAPNRIVYRASAERPTSVVLPLAQPGWRVEGLPVGTRSGRLALDLPSGERDLVIRYRPPQLHAGAAVSAATLVALAVWWTRSRRRGAARPATTAGRA
jgi:hypothetical protein